MKKSFHIIIIFAVLLVILAAAGIYYVQNYSFDRANINNTILYEEDEEGGTLKAVVRNVVCYDTLSAAGIGIEELEKDSCVAAFDEETGLLLDQYHVVLVEVEIENIDAVSRSHFEAGQYRENVFRADRLVLADTTRKVTSKNFYISNPVYFSEKDTCEEHPFAYQLSIGEKKVFTLGYLVENDNLEDLYLCPTSGYVKGAFAAIVD